MATVVTQHSGLVEYLREQGYAVDEVKKHVQSAEEIQGRDVVGVLPPHLAAEANSVTTVNLRLSREDFGRELSLEEVRERVISTEVYRVYREEDFQARMERIERDLGVALPERYFSKGEGEPVVVTNQPDTARYLKDAGYAPQDAVVVEQARIEDVRGKEVIGTVPLYLAAEAERVQSVQFNLTEEERAAKVRLNYEMMMERQPSVETFRVFSEQQLERALDRVAEQAGVSREEVQRFMEKGGPERDYGRSYELERG
jgi:putative CRISPR-associated protein (TIGR02620 family)